MLMLKCDYILHKYSVPSIQCPNIFGIFLGMCNMHLCREKLNLPFMSLVLLSSVFSEGPLQKINKLVKDFPLTKTGIFFAVTSSFLWSTQHAGFKTQILINKWTVVRWVMRFLPNQKVLHYWGQSGKMTSN